MSFFNSLNAVGSSGFAATNREVVFGAAGGAGGSLLPNDFRAEYCKVWLTTDSARSLHKEISVAALGSIANINADAWTNGTVVAP